MTTTAQPAVVLPSPVGDLMGAVRRSVAELRGRAPGTEAGAWPHEDREAAIGALDALVTELTLYRGQVLRAHEKAGTWGSISDRDFADYRSRTTGTGRGAAMGEVQLAEGLEQLPAVAEAVEEGKLHLEHAKTLTRLHRTASPEVRKALTDDGGLDRLLEQATRDELTAPDLGKVAKAWAAKVDAAAAQRDFDTVRRRRSLTLRQQAGGVAGEFFLDPVAGDELRTALEAIAGQPAAGDDRTREQRMADALSTMAGRTLQVGADLVGAQVRPHLSLLVSEQTWAAVSVRRAVLGGETAEPRPPWPHVPPAELEDGTAVPLGELERLMCDSEVTRMVMDAAGVPLDVGRTQRTYTKELRRAVLARDRRCMWPRCRIRASWSEVHHITWFSRGGHTSLAEAICLCSYHHHRVHDADVLITVLPDGFDFHRRDGSHIGTSTRRPMPDALLPCATPPAAGRESRAPRIGGQRVGQSPLSRARDGTGGPSAVHASLPRDAAGRAPRRRSLPRAATAGQDSGPMHAPATHAGPRDRAHRSGSRASPGTDPPGPQRPGPKWPTAPMLWDSDPPC